MTTRKIVGATLIAALALGLTLAFAGSWWSLPIAAIVVIGLVYGGFTA